MSVASEVPAPARAGASARRRTLRAGRVLSAVAFVAAGAIVLSMMTGSFSDFAVFTVATIGVYAVAAVGQDWLIGQAGQVSLGGAAFMAMGAFTVAATTGSPLGYWPIQLALAGVLGGALGFAVGLPALRLRGMYLLLATLALQFVMVFATSRYQGTRPTGFTIPAPHIGSWTFGSDRSMLGFIAVVLLCVCLFSYSVRRHAPGRYWRSLRESELASASLGIDVTRWKLLAFVGSSVETAIAGALYAMLLGLVTYNAFTLNLALGLALMVFLGGRSTILGPILGAAAVTLLPQGLTALSSGLGTTGTVGTWLNTNQAFVVEAIYGLALLVILLAEPDGMMGLLRRAGRRIDRRGGRPAAAALASAAVAPVASARLAPADEGRPQVVLTTAGAATSNGAALAAAGRTGGGTDAEALVETAGLAVRYPNGALGLSDLTFSLRGGSIVALVGRNGAGKTSALRALAGFPRAEHVHVSGDMRLSGVPVTRHDPVRMRGAGIVLVPERNKVFPRLTVAEHLRLAGLSASRLDETMERFPQLQPLRTRRAGLLSGGERQLLAVVAATANPPRLLLIDEPSLGLSPVATRTVVDVLLALRDEHGMTVLLTEQVTETVESVADAFYVMDHGQIVFAGVSQDLRRADVRAAVMGS